MPKIADLTNAAIYMYIDDHAPPHFHVVGPDSDAQIRMSDLQVMRGKIGRRDPAEAIGYAAEHADHLDAKWREYNERD
jgi:hypothetical protein